MGTFVSMTISMVPNRIPQWTFGERVRKVRRQSDLTQVEFAEKLGVTRAALESWESGRNEPRNIVDVAVRLEAITGVPRQWFLGWLDGAGPGGPGASVGEAGIEPATFRVESRPFLAVA